MPTASKHNEDFVAIKMGDVTNNAIAHNVNGSISRHSDQLHLEIADGKLVAGELYELQIMSSNFTDIAGYQFSLKFDQEAMVFEGLEKAALDVS